MADSRRSSRSRKQVDYSKFSGGGDGIGDFAEDDDFVSFTPPLSKSKKPANPKKDKPTKKEQEKSSKEDGGKRKKKKERMSLDDKIYERDLQMALELSQEKSADEDLEPPHLEPVKPIKPISDDDAEGGGTDENENDCVPKLSDRELSDSTDQEKTEDKIEHVDVRDDRESSPEIGVIIKKKAAPKKKGTKRKKADDDPDEITVLEKDIVEKVTGGRSKRRAATKAVKKFVNTDSDDSDLDSDDSFRAEGFDDHLLDDDSDSVYNEEDEDFDAAPKSKKKGKGRAKSGGANSGTASPKPKPKPRMSVTVTPVNTNLGRTQGLGKSFTPKPSTSLPGLNNNPPIRSSSGPLNIRRPNWMPPGAAGTSRSGDVKSPGNLRVGLSKRARIKPLHSPHVNA